MAVYRIPSDNEIKEYMQNFPLEYITKGDFSYILKKILRVLRTPYPVVDINLFFTFDMTNYNYSYGAFVNDVIAFILSNDIARVYYCDYDDGNDGFIIFPHSEKDEDKDLFLIMNDNLDFPEQSIDRETFISAYTRIDNMGNKVPVKI